MIICQCNVLSDRQINEAVETLLDKDPMGLVIPGSVYRSLGCRGKCGTCFPTVARMIADAVERRTSEDPGNRQEKRR